MLKIMNPFQREPLDNESVAFRIYPMACVCNVNPDNYAVARKNSPPGSGQCTCSCIDTVNGEANFTMAYDYEHR